MDFEEFSQLLIEMVEASNVSSNPHYCKKHPNYAKIIEAKNFEDIIGFTCLHLGESSIHEVLAILYDLIQDCRQPPIDKYYWGRMAVIVECWRAWALKNNYVKVNYNATSYWVEDKYGNRGDWH